MGNRQSSLGSLPQEYPKRQDPVVYDSKVDYAESHPIEDPPTYSEARGPTSSTREFDQAYQPAPQYGQTYQSQPQPTRQFSQWHQPQTQYPSQFGQTYQPQAQPTRQFDHMYREPAVPFRTEQGLGYAPRAPRGRYGGRHGRREHKRERREWRDQRRECRRNQITGIFNDRH